MQDTWVDWLSWAILALGGLDWGLVGFFRFDLVGSVLGGTLSEPSRVVFAIVGIAALWQVVSRAGWTSRTASHT